MEDHADHRRQERDGERRRNDNGTDKGDQRFARDGKGRGHADILEEKVVKALVPIVPIWRE